MNNDYNIADAFDRIENILLSSMKRNLSKHLKEEKELEINWTAWQAEQLKSLNYYRKKNKKMFKDDFREINELVEELLIKSNSNGKLEQEKNILNSIKNGHFKTENKEIGKLYNIYQKTKNKRIKKKNLARLYDKVSSTESTFFKINDNKLKALIDETVSNFKLAENSILRYTNDQYRKIIFDAQVYANTGAGTPQQAIDMATRDFLARGITCIQYASGRMVNISSYAAMAIKTAQTRAKLYGEGIKRDEWGVHTVVVPNRGGGCPNCVKFQGKIFIDDVYSGGTKAESLKTNYPLISIAIKNGFLHPNCKDTFETYFEGINTDIKRPTEDEIKEKTNNYIKEQKLKYIDSNIKKYENLEKFSLDESNIKKYHNKVLDWKEFKRRYISNNSINFNDVEEYNKIKNIVGDNRVDSFEKCHNMKYNNTKEYDLLKREYKTIRNIKNSSDNVERDVETYYKFKSHGIEATNHFIEHYYDRMYDKNNNKLYDFDKIVDTSKKVPNYFDSEQRRNIRFYDKIVLISEVDTNEFVTMRYGRGKKTWKEL